MVNRVHRMGLTVAGVIVLVVLLALGGSWFIGQVVTAFSDDRPSSAEGWPPTSERSGGGDEPTAPDGSDHGEVPTDVPHEAPTEAPGVLPPDVAEEAEGAIVDRVVDADTVRVVAVPGGSIPEGGSIRVRLLNIDTPELARDGLPADCGAQEATERLEELIATGDLVWLVGDREDRDVYDRPLRGMWTDDGVFLNEVLAEEGFAEALLIDPNDRFHDRIVAAVDRAQRDNRGIWGELCPG